MCVAVPRPEITTDVTELDPSLSPHHNTTQHKIPRVRISIEMEMEMEMEMVIETAIEEEEEEEEAAFIHDCYK